MNILNTQDISFQAPSVGRVTVLYRLLYDGEEWGLRCEIPETGEIAQAERVTPDRMFAENLMEKLASGEVTPVTFFDILYDLMP